MKRAVSTLLMSVGISLASHAQSDLCAGATLVSCGSVVSGNTTAAGADVAPFCGTTDGTAGGVWFRFVGTGNNVIASLCGSGYDTKIRIYSGTCAAPVCVAGNDDFCGLQSQVTWATTLGTTYYILVHGFGAATGNYTLTITCPPPPVPMCYVQAAAPYAADPYAGTAVTLTDDVHSAVVNIGFSFCFNSNTYTQCLISSNNYITFNLTEAGLFSPWTTVAAPNATPTQPHNSVMDPWQDIDPGVGGSIFYQTLGVAPNRRFVVSYLNVPMFSCNTQIYSSQIILYERTNCIRSNILSKPLCPTWNNGNAVHGLQNNGGTSATVVPGRNNTQWTAASEGRLWGPTCAPCSTAFTGPCLSVILPAELLHFKGAHIGGVNILEWSTASETNTVHFTVERSADGLEFDDLLTTAAAGHSNSTIDYILRDEDPMPGENFYRLRTTDADGTIDLSGVVLVHADVSAGPAVFPNPASAGATYRLPEHVPLPAWMSIRDHSGRVLSRFRAHAGQGDVPVEGLANGTYVLVVEQGASRPSVRFSIAR